MRISEWRERAELEREEKDRSFKMHPQSPISIAERQSFKGLNYYSLDLKYRFELELHEYERKEILKIEDTQGNEREFLRWGEFRFKIGDTDCVLQAYKSSYEEERLFIPFRDATSGIKTYGAGRYIDLESSRHQTSEGKWILDFNQAYNPWCAYSSFYACPYVPPENWLKVKVSAGEKTYP